MEDCPEKWSHRSFKENDILSVVKVVGKALELTAKQFFTLTKYRLQILVVNYVSANIERGFWRCFPSHPMAKLILLHAVVVLHYITHIMNKWHSLSKGEGSQNAQKLIIIDTN